MHENFKIYTLIFNEANPDKRLKKLTNFNYEQIYCLFKVVAFLVQLALYTGRERKYQDSIQDLLYKLLVTLKQVEG